MKQPVYKPIYFYPKDPKNQWSRDEITQQPTSPNYYNKIPPVNGIYIANQPSEYELKFLSSSYHQVAIMQVLSSIYPELIGMTIKIDCAIFDKALLEGKVEADGTCTILKGKYVFKNKGHIKLCEP